MTLDQLVTLAKAKDLKFAKQYDKHARSGKIKFNWLMKRLEQVHGKVFMKNAVEAEIARQKTLQAPNQG